MGLSLIDENEEDPESDDIKTIHHRQQRVTSFTLPSIIHRCVFSTMYKSIKFENIQLTSPSPRIKSKSEVKKKKEREI